MFLSTFSFGKIPSIDFGDWFSSCFKAFKASTYFIRLSSIVFVCFSNAALSGEIYKSSDIAGYFLQGFAKAPNSISDKWL